MNDLIATGRLPEPTQELPHPGRRCRLGAWTAFTSARPRPLGGVLNHVRLSRCIGELMTPGSNRWPWRETLARFAVPCLRHGLFAVATSAVPYAALCVVMYLTLGVSPTVMLAIAAAGFMVQVFVVFHDCAHGSLLASRRANAVLGTVLGLLVLSPFRWWRHDHAVHHATSGDLDRRGVGDILTLTVTEYRGPASVRGCLLAARGRLELCRCRPARELVSEAAEGAAVLHGQHRTAPRASPQPADTQLQPPARARFQPDVRGGADALALGRAPQRQAQVVR